MLNLKLIALTLAFAVAGVASVGVAQTYRHDHIQTVEDEQLSSVIQLESTANGKQIYSVGFQPGYVLGFDVDPKTGKLKKAYSLLKYKVLSLDFSQDAQRAVICCNMGKGKVSLYNRKLESGEFVISHEIYEEQFDGLKGNISVEFSVDGDQVYVVTSENRLLIFQLDKGLMTLIQEHSGAENGLGQCKDVTRSPSGDYIFVSSSDSGTIAVFSREEDGRLTFCSSIQDESLQAALLAGVHGIAVSPDDKHLYAASGRFTGDHAVSGFRITDEATLEKVCEFENGIELEGFEGGRYIKVSPDGKFVYASAIHSEKVGCFGRDPESGMLQFHSYLSVSGSEELGKVSGITFSNEGEFVYVAIESQAKILTFKRSVDSN